MIIIIIIFNFYYLLFLFYLVLIYNSFLVSWIRNNDIMDQLYGDNLHPELVKRSIEIPIFLAKENSLTENDIEFIWNAGAHKHEAITHVIYNVIESLSPYLNSSQLNFIFEKLKTIPCSSYDNRTMQLVRTLFKLEIQNVNNNPEKSMGLKILWNIIQDSSNAPNEVKQIAINYFNNDINWIEAELLQTAMILKCLKNVRKHTSVCSSYKVIMSIFNYYLLHEINLLPSLVFRIEEIYNFTHLCFDDLQYYKNHVRSFKDLNKDISINQMMFDSKHPYLQEIRERLGFLEYLLCYLVDGISEVNINVFWECIIDQAITEEERDLGYYWLNNLSQKSSFAGVISYIFHEKFLKLNQWSPSAFSVICTYFKIINSNRNSLDLIGNQITVKSFELEGVEIFWNIMLNSTSLLPALSAIETLNLLYTNIDSSLSDKIANQRKEYIDQCMNHLINGKKENNYQVITRCLFLLKQFIEEFESKLVYSNKHCSQKRGKPISLKVYNVFGDDFEIFVYNSTTIKALKYLIAFNYQRDINLLKFTINLKDLPDDTKTIENSGMALDQIIEVSVSRSPQAPRNELPVTENELPSYILSREEMYYKELFESLELNQDIAQYAWEILMLLPTNQKIYNSISSITISTNWNELLNTKSMYKLLYSLQIIESILNISNNNNNNNNNNSEDNNNNKLTVSDSNNNVNIQWTKLFEGTGGLGHMIEIFIHQLPYDNSTSSSSTHYKACMILILQITVFLLSKDPGTLIEKYIIRKKYSDAIVGRLLNIIQSSCNFNINHNNNHNHNNHNNNGDEDIKIAELAYTMMELCCKEKQIINCFLKYNSLEEWVYRVLIHCNDNRLRESTKNSLSNIYSKSKSLISQSPKIFFDLLIKCVLIINQEDSSKAGQYFDILNKLTSDQISENSLFIKSFHSIFDQLIQLLQTHPIVEKNNDTREDSVIAGILTLIKTIVSSDIDLKESAGEMLINEIFKRCLAGWSVDVDHNYIDASKCKRNTSKVAAYQLLTELAKGNQKNFQSLSSYLLSQHERLSHNVIENVWQYSPSEMEKASGFVGLKNLGATCYMNSLMQQFYMIPDFRRGLLSLSVDHLNDINNDQISTSGLLFQLQTLFGYLQYSEKRFYDTTEFCKAYSDFESFNPSQQMDADEFFNLLFEKLESQLQNTNYHSYLKDFFGGKVCNQIISQDCSHVSEKLEDFFTISVAVKGKSNLLDSLELFVEGDKLEGENKYECTQCDSKVEALKRSCIYSLPNHLIIHMRRFEFDIETLCRMKVDDLCEFPMELNMEPYTKEGLANREKKGSVPLKAPSYYKFELVGVLVHSGTADYGHYFSFIKDRDKDSSSYGRWFEFNDRTVELFDEKNIAYKCYGGSDVIMQYDSTLRKKIPQTITRPENAYMLFYQRIDLEPSTFDIPSRPINLSLDIIDEIYSENLQFLQDKLIFHPSYFHFINDLLSLSLDDQNEVGYEGDLSSSPILYQSIQLGIVYFIKCLSRSREKDLISFENVYKKLLSKHLPACRWLLKQSMKEGWANEFLVFCTNQDTRSSFTSIFLHSLITLLPFEQSKYFQTSFNSIPNPIPNSTPNDSDQLMDTNNHNNHNDNHNDNNHNNNDEDNDVDQKKEEKSGCECVTIEYIESLLSLIPTVKNQWNNAGEYLKFLIGFAKLGADEKKYLLSRSIISRFVECYIGPDSPLSLELNLPSKKLITDKYSITNVSLMIDLISELVCSTKLTLHEKNSPVSRLLNHSLSLTEIDHKSIHCIAFYRQMIADNLPLGEIPDLLTHLVWEDLSFSDLIIQSLIESLNFTENGKMVLDILFKILLLDDLQEERVAIAVPLLLNDIDTINRFTLKLILEFFTRLVPYNKPLYRSLMLAQIGDHPWILKTLVNDFDKVREASLDLIKQLYSQQDHFGEFEVKKMILDLLFLAPSSFNTSHYHPTNATISNDQSDFYSTSPWKLVEYLQAVMFFIDSKEDVPLFVNHFSTFFDLLTAIDIENQNMDENKTMLLRLFEKLFDIDIQLCSLIYDNPSYTDRLLRLNINLQGTDQNIIYNNIYLACYFRLILQCCIQNREFKEQFEEHKNLSWSIKYIYLNTSFEMIAEIIYQILKEMMPNQKLRTSLLSCALEQSSSTKNLKYNIKLLDGLLISNDDFVMFHRLGGLEYLSTFHDLKDLTATPQTSDLVITLLNIFIKVTKDKYTDDDLNVDPNSTSKDWNFDILEIIQSYIVVFSDNDLILNLSFKLLYQLSSMNSSIMECTLQYLVQQHKENFNNKSSSSSSSNSSSRSLPSPLYSNRNFDYYKYVFSICNIPLSSEAINSVGYSQTLG